MPSRAIRIILTHSSSWHFPFETFFIFSVGLPDCHSGNQLFRGSCHYIWSSAKNLLLLLFACSLPSGHVQHCYFHSTPSCAGISIITGRNDWPIGEEIIRICPRDLSTIFSVHWIYTARQTPPLPPPPRETSTSTGECPVDWWSLIFYYWSQRGRRFFLGTS